MVDSVLDVWGLETPGRRFSGIQSRPSGPVPARVDLPANSELRNDGELRNPVAAGSVRHPPARVSRRRG
jgi:hypothetical protein